MRPLCGVTLGKHSRRGSRSLQVADAAVLIYHTLLASIDHLRERTDRQLFSSQNQIRMQNIAMREAQAMEQKAQATKKSFVSYIFHEVRVPLNTALLALQNLDGEDVFKDLDNDQAIMVNGLMGSLTMMEKVRLSTAERN